MTQKQFDNEQQELEYLREQNAKLKAQNESGLSIKVSKAGAVSVYGLGRFPVTLYKSQWDKLFGRVDEIKTFIETNEHRLATKQPKEPISEDTE